MKKLIILFVCICGFIFSLQNAAAQTCSSNFTVNTSVTNSTCMANGKIKVTLSGDLTNLSNIQYILETIPSSGIPTVQNTDEFLYLAPGTYKVTVRAFCAVDAQWEAVKEVSNVVVGGTYQPPQASLNSTVSRNSYANCPKGIIALDVAGGNGTFTFTLVSAPGGVTVPQTLSVKAQSGNTYTLSGSQVGLTNGDAWPAGSYEIQVADNCFNAWAKITLNTITGFPTFAYPSQEGFRPDLEGTRGCNVVGWVSYSNLIFSNPDYQRYLNDGLYQIGSYPTSGSTVQSVSNVTNWVTWTASNYTSDVVWLNLGLGNNINQYYSSGTNTLAIYTRVKDCSSSYDAIPVYIFNPASFPPSVLGYCSTMQTIPESLYRGVLCYPLTLTISGTPGYTKTNWLYNKDYDTQIPLAYTGQTVTFTDQLGTSTTLTPYPNYTMYYVSNCNNYNLYYYVSISGYVSISCPTSWAAVITVTDQTTSTQVSKDTVYYNTYKISSGTLNYSTNHSVSVEYASGNIVQHSTPINISNSDALSPQSISPYTIDACVVNRGSFVIYSAGGTTYWWPQDTQLTLEGPSGFTTQTINVSPGPGHGWHTSTVNLPVGEYTFTENRGGTGGCIKTIKYNFPGGNNYYNFGHGTPQRTCEGLKITPTGTVTYLGNNASTYFRIMSGPSGGYNPAPITSGNSILLQTPGEYVLGILTSNSSSACALATDTIIYKAEQLALDPSVTSAYFCVGGSVGHIFLSAANGVAPYTYELWDEYNSVKQPVPDIETSGVAHFAHGSAGVTYTVRVKDACNNSFSQKVTVSDLQTAKIVYVAENKICTGGTLELKCTTLGIAQYHWTGPHGFLSDDQNPVRVDFNSSMVGWYKVSVSPEYCGLAVEDSIYIDIYNAYSILNSATDYIMCSGSSTVPEIIGGTVSGGSGSYIYQWQFNYNGGVAFYDVSGATSVNYTPTSQMIAGGQCFYRLQIKDKCGTIYSNTKHVIVKSCGIPINPILMNKVQP